MNAANDHTVRAPSFRLDAQDGTTFDSRSLDGQPWIVFFFPRAFSPASIALAQGFRDRRSDFDRLGVQLLGVSSGSSRLHAAFDRQHLLELPLLSDLDGEVSRGFGAWRDSSLLGLREGAPRLAAALVAADGTLVELRPGWRPTRIVEHALAAAERLVEKAA